MESFADDLVLSDNQMFSRRNDDVKIAQGNLEEAATEFEDMDAQPDAAVNETPSENGNNSTNTDSMNNDQKEKRLSKGGQKRLKAFLAQGVPEEEARKRAFIIPPPQERQNRIPPKRLNTNNRTDNRRGIRTEPWASKMHGPIGSGAPRPLISYPLPIARRSYGAPTNEFRSNAMVYRRQFKDPAHKLDPRQVRIGVLPINYPIDLLASERMKEIEDQILKKIIQHKDSNMKPGFLSSIHRIGYILFIAKDRATAHWLKNLYNWAIEGLQVVDIFDNFTTNVMEGTFPQCADMSTSAVFDLVKGQNAGLYPERWKLISEVATGTALQLVIAMDDMSLETLEREKFKLYFKFVIVKLDHCMGRPEDLIMAHKKFCETGNNVAPIMGNNNTPQLTQFQGRETYGSAAECNRENVYSSDFYYNRH